MSFLAACRLCADDEYIVTPCTPMNDTVCAKLPSPCLLNGFCGDLHLRDLPRAISNRISSLDLRNNSIFAVDSARLSLYPNLSPNTRCDRSYSRKCTACVTRSVKFAVRCDCSAFLTEILVRWAACRGTASTPTSECAPTVSEASTSFLLRQ